MSEQGPRDDRPAETPGLDQVDDDRGDRAAGAETAPADTPAGEAAEAPPTEGAGAAATEAVESQPSGQAEAEGSQETDADTAEPSQAAVVVEPPSASADRTHKPAPRQRVPERMAGVCLADGKVFDFDPGKLDLSMGDQVVVSNDRDLNLGRIRYLVPNRSGKHLRKVLRRVGPHDLLLMRRNSKREEEAFEFCSRRIAERKLPMKLVQAAFLHGGNKAIFFFTADGRVDFRALVRDLAQELHVRIEMRQIGVRDEAKLLGGIGICGQPLCCARYLKKFVPVSIKMAKNQGLALNPQKVSGLCGRLMCCLVYEDDTYKNLRKGFPKMGKTIETPGGPAKVVEADVLAGRVRVVGEGGYMTYTIGQLRGEEEVPAAELEKIRPRPARRPRPRPRRPTDRRRPVKAGGEEKEAEQAKPAERDGEAKRTPKRRRRRRKPGRSDRTAGQESQRADGQSGRERSKDQPGEQAKDRPGGQPKDRANDQSKDADQAAASKRKKRRRRSRRRRKKSKDGNQTGGQGSSDGGEG